VPPVLTDSAVLARGFNPTGTITFTLLYNGGTTPVDTEVVPVNGVGIYTTPVGFTLPTSGAAAGTYQWNAVYSGDSNNAPVGDVGEPDEQVTVDPATPTLATTPTPAAVTLNTKSVTLTDTATLTGGFNPTGSITFTLFHGSTLVDTETVAVNGNGTYSTPTGFTLPTTGTVTGSYQWDATYSGDPNNNTVSDNNDPPEHVTVAAASPTITTSPTPSTVTLNDSSVTLIDRAILPGGYNPTGTITFTLFYNGGTTPVDTEVVSVNGNGIYATPTGFKLPAGSTVTGTYQWNATYSGDANNNPDIENGATNEVVTVVAANPALVTVPGQPVIAPGAKLTDSATLSRGFNPTGTITFTLFFNGGTTPIDTETVAVNGNGTYTTPTGFPLPGTGTVAGTYQWDATYNGDGNNTAVSDNNAANEQVILSPVTPTLSGTPNPATVTLGPNPVTLADTATLTGGFRPGGTITFTLFYNGGTTPIDTETVPVNGNGTYTTPTGFPLPTTGTVTGTYQWDVSYSGDPNNNPVVDNNASSQEVIVNPAVPTISNTPDPAQGQLGVTLQDTATLSGSYHGTGSVIFSLYAPGVNPTVGPVTYTETVPVSADGVYHTTTGFTSNATGTWHWVAAYTGDANNDSVASGPLAAPVTIGRQSDLELTKTVDPSQVLLGENVVYSFTLHNEGPDAATNVVVTDPFPAGATLVGPFSPSQGTFDPATGIWSVGTLPNGGAAILTVVAQITVLGPVANTATAQSDQFDPNLSDATSTAVVTGMRQPQMVSKQFFLDSFNAPAVTPADAVFAGVPAVANGLSLGSPAPAAGLAGLDSLFASLGRGSTLGQPAVPAVAAPALTQPTGGGTAFDSFGPLYGNTVGAPLDTAGLVAQGQPLAGGGTGAAESSADVLRPLADEQLTLADL
jgi:uncharacterized repeat protein (TIGR01451 family)